jgi:plastocyanin
MLHGNKPLIREGIMKVKSIFSIAVLVSSLAIFALAPGCAAGQTKTIITTSGTVTVSVAQVPMTIPVTTYPVKQTLIPGDMYVVIGGGYADSVTNVTIGQKFMWVNMDHEAHTVTSIGEYGGLFDFTLQPGDAVEYSFKNADTYEYYCKLHPGEDAVIIVDQNAS